MALADTRPDLSIVILNYGAGNLLLPRMRSVYENARDASFECVVIDNASRERETLSLAASRRSS